MVNKIDIVKHAANFVDLTGKQFGKLEVLSYHHRDHGGTYWKCQCECGRQSTVRRDALYSKKHPTRSCRYCANKIVLKRGTIFGHIKVLSEGEKPTKRSQGAFYSCKCMLCGKIMNIRAIKLIARRTLSCGCDVPRNNAKSMIGKKFGRLKVLQYDGRRKKEESRLLCLCDCGNHVSVRRSYLLSGKTKSCGCYQKEQITQYNYNRFVSIVGNSYGSLKVIRMLGNVKNSSNKIYLTKCICGRFRKCRDIILKNGQATCCVRCGGLKETSIEKVTRTLLRKLKIRYKSQFCVRLGRTRRTIADFSIINYNLLIYCDGDYWHRRPGCQTKDRKITKDLEAKGFSVLRFWEKDLLKRPEWCQQKILDTIARIKLQLSHV